MKQHEGRDTRQLIVALTLVATLVVTGLLLNGFSQTTLALAPAALETSTKTASADTVPAGGEVTYEIVLRNDTVSPVGPVQVTDVLPDDTTFVAVDYPATAGISLITDDLSNPRYFTFTVPSVGAESSIVLSLVVDIASSLQKGDVITNTAVISQGGVPLNRSAVITITAAPTARIDVPWDNQVITQRGQFTVRGRAWTADQTPEFPTAPVLQPIIYQTGRDWYVVEWSGVSGATFYILEEAKNPNFSNAQTFPSSAALARNIDGQSPGTYYYRVKARNAYDESFWSNVVSVTVTSASAAGIEAAPAAVAYQPGVEINIKPVGEADNWVPVSSITAGTGEWWNWSYEWTLPQEDDAAYVIQVRGTDLGGTYDPSLVDTVTVTLQNGTTLIYLPVISKRYPPVPYAPTVQVNDNDSAGNYKIAWSYSHSTLIPTSYRFQESTDANFAALTMNEIRTSPQTFTGKAAGTYYYRVRGINSAGEGEWSNVVMVEVRDLSYYDDFSDAGSGWPRKVEYIEGRPVFDMSYDNGSYRAKIMLDTAGRNNYLMGIVRAPFNNQLSHYEVSVEHRFAIAGDQAAAPDEGKGGLIFAASGDYRTLFIVEWNYPAGRCAVSKYTGIDKPVVDMRDFLGGNGSIRQWGSCPVQGGYDKITTARAIVNGTSASVYINNQLVTQFSDSALGSSHQVGFITGAWMFTPVDGRFDNFRVTPR